MIRFEQVGKRYPNGHVGLHELSFRARRGEFLFVTGHSGAGKSTLLRLLLGLFEVREPAPQVSGVCLLLGEDLTRGYPQALRGRVGAVLQDEGLLDELSPRANVEFALQARGRSEKLALGLLAQAGIAEPPERVTELSGGMRKRVAIARALASEPELFLFDEPTAGLDPPAAREMATLLRDTLARPGGRGRATAVVVTHDLEAFAELADGILHLDPATRGLGLHTPAAGWRRRAEAGPHAERGAGDALHGARRFLLELAALAETLAEAVLRLPPVFLRQTVAQSLRFLVEPALFVLTACATVGGLATYFAVRNNPLQGAFVPELLTGAGKVLVAALVPLVAAIFFTARMAAGAAARIGTMRRTNQVAALQLLGVRPADYLLTPLTWAMAISLPVLTLGGVVGAAYASFVAAWLVHGIGFAAWVQAFGAALGPEDLRYGLAKALVSGLLVAWLTWHLAMAPKPSGHAVGEAVNRSIVLGLFAVLLVHALWTLAQFG